MEVPVPPRPDPTRRFSDRVEAYVRFRPGYPREVLDALAAEAGLGPGSVVADLGAGTGIFSELLLARGASVVAVEPNAAMRVAAEERLGDDPRFTSVAAPAEETGLAAASVDLVTAAQAFHWFDCEAVRREIARILRPGGRVALLWNARRTDATPFLRDYEELLRDFGTDYREVDHTRIGEEELAAFFRGSFAAHRFPNQQSFDLAGLEGRLLSSSYAPAPGQPRYESMIRALRRLFAMHAEQGRVRFLYVTELYLGGVDG